jgi:UDP-sugar pyrophosphorylase
MTLSEPIQHCNDNRINWLDVLIYYLPFLPSLLHCRTVNVEYNQLDPLLRSTAEFKDGDINDETGFSPFPGNINQLVFKLDAYNKVLSRTKGIMPDFVNPKYKDESKTVFKKPTRLECMMQEFPTVLNGEESKRVGFTQAAAEICFSPVKNALSDGAALQTSGTPAGTAATGEADQYAAQRIFLRCIGVKVEDAPSVVYSGIQVVPGPAIVLKPDFACCPGELKRKFPSPEKVNISSRSTLVVRGAGVTIESLELDGCLLVDVEKGESLVLKDVKVINAGWVQKAVKDSEDEVIQMRGFFIDRKDARYMEVRADPAKKKAEKPDDTSITAESPYDVEGGLCGVNFGATKKPNDWECAICTIS